MVAIRFSDTYSCLFYPKSEAPKFNDLIFDLSLAGRGTESQESLARRLEAAVADMAFGETKGNFDIVILNQELDTAYAAFLAFVREKYPILS